jgi:hypothetical protein
MALAVLGGARPTLAAANPPQPAKPARAAATPQVYPTVGAATARASYTLSLTGTAVNFELSGLEPDFDPLYRVIIDATLHDRRPTGLALPDARLILSAYLEVFQPDTTPVLPDLLHPDQVATDLGGFLQGKAVLLNRGGQIVYRGSLLAEIFADSTEHLVVDLMPAISGKGVQPVRLQGVVTLHRGGAENATLRALQPLARAALDVPKGKEPSWKTVIDGISVHRPAMMGTGGTAAGRAPAKSAAPAHRAAPKTAPAECGAACRATRPATVAPVILVVAVIIGGIAWYRRQRLSP